MTNREFFVAISTNESLSGELRDFATEAIAKLDHTNSLRRDAAAKKAVAKEAERAPIREAVMAALSSEPKTATTLIAEAGVDIKPQAIPSLLKGALEDGTVVKSFIKVTGKGKHVGYAIA